MAVRPLVAAAGAALLEVSGPAATAYLPLGGIGSGSGRLGATVALVVVLVGVVAGGLALRSAGRTGSGRTGAVVALVVAPTGVALALVHLATATGGIGTGNGRAGAIVALVVGLAGVVIGALALARSRRTG